MICVQEKAYRDWLFIKTNQFGLCFFSEKRKDCINSSFLMSKSHRISLVTVTVQVPDSALKNYGGFSNMNIASHLQTNAIYIITSFF